MAKNREAASSIGMDTVCGTDKSTTSLVPHDPTFVNPSISQLNSMERGNNIARDEEAENVADLERLRYGVQSSDSKTALGAKQSGIVSQNASYVKVEKVGPRHRRTVTQGMTHLIQDINKSGEIRKRETNKDTLLVTPEYVLSH